MLQRAGPLSLSVNQMGALVRSGPGLERPDTQLYFSPLSYSTDYVGRRPLLRPDGQVYLEAPRAWGDEELQSLGWHCHRRGRAGTVHYHLLTLTEAGTAPGAGDNPAP